MDAWGNLQRELDLWVEIDRCATLWWRDDDAMDITPSIEKLIDLSSSAASPVLLAAIPSRLTPAFKSYAFPEMIRLAQHGYSHTNHSVGNAKKCEFGSGREQAEMIDEITDGHQIIRSLKNGVSVFVPPWNRIDTSLLSTFNKIGIKVLSTFMPRTSPEPVPGLRQVNTHADIMDWRGSRGFVGEKSILNQITNHLSARRTGLVDMDEPTGLLTHHLVHDSDCWRFLESFMQRTSAHPATTWLQIDAMMAA